jgi:hypothetical protein
VADDLEASEREGLLARIEQQALLLAEQRALLYRRDQELREARAALHLVTQSRVYRLARRLGRWGWLKHRIRRVLG